MRIVKAGPAHVGNAQGEHLDQGAGSLKENEVPEQSETLTSHLDATRITGLIKAYKCVVVYREDEILLVQTKVDGPYSLPSAVLRTLALWSETRELLSEHLGIAIGAIKEAKLGIFEETFDSSDGETEDQYFAVGVAVEYGPESDYTTINKEFIEARRWYKIDQDAELEAADPLVRRATDWLGRKLGRKARAKRPTRPVAAIRHPLAGMGEGGK